MKLPRANGMALTVEKLAPTNDVRIVLGTGGKHAAFIILLASELEHLHDAIGRELDRQRQHHGHRRPSASKEAGIAARNRMKFLREKGQRDGYVSCLRDDLIDLRVREGRIEHRPSSISEEHAALLVDYRAELLTELDEIARTVAVAPKARAMGISGRGGIR